MVNTNLERELHQQMEHLPLGQQRQVLDFARALASARARGVEGRQLLQFAGMIDRDELKIFAQAIADDCEKVDENEW